MEYPSIYTGIQPYIFVSFSHMDSARVYPIITQLQQRGYRIWYDAGVKPGAEWDENIAARIIRCSYIFAFISASYLESQNCRDELSFARDKDKPRLLIFLDELKLPDGMAMRLNRHQAVYWNRFKNDRDALDKVCEAQELEPCRQHGPTAKQPTGVQGGDTDEKVPKSKWEAFFLCLFLGIFGAHKFYEGKNRWGLLYLFTCGLVFVGALVDLIAILSKPNPYYVTVRQKKM